MGKCYRQLNYDDRLRFEKMYQEGYSKGEIAEHLHIHRNTVTNELKRGRYLHRNSDYTEEWRYSAELAEKHYQENTAMRGTQLKIANDYEYAEYLEAKIADEGYSPEAVLGELKTTGKEKQFKTKVCATTIYNYIDKGVFFRLSNKDLPVKGKKKENTAESEDRKEPVPEEQLRNDQNL